MKSSVVNLFDQGTQEKMSLIADKINQLNDQFKKKQIKELFFYEQTILEYEKLCELTLKLPKEKRTEEYWEELIKQKRDRIISYFQKKIKEKENSEKEAHQIILKHYQELYTELQRNYDLSKDISYFGILIDLKNKIITAKKAVKGIPPHKIKTDHEIAKEYFELYQLYCEKTQLAKKQKLGNLENEKGLEGQLDSIFLAYQFNLEEKGEPRKGKNEFGPVLIGLIQVLIGLCRDEKFNFFDKGGDILFVKKSKLIYFFSDGIKTKAFDSKSSSNVQMILAQTSYFLSAAYNRALKELEEKFFTGENVDKEKLLECAKNSIQYIEKTIAHIKGNKTLDGFMENKEKTLRNRLEHYIELLIFVSHRYPEFKPQTRQFIEQYIKTEHSIDRQTAHIFLCLEEPGADSSYQAFKKMHKANPKNPIILTLFLKSALDYISHLETPKKEEEITEIKKGIERSLLDSPLIFPIALERKFRPFLERAARFWQENFSSLGYDDQNTGEHKAALASFVLTQQAFFMHGHNVKIRDSRLRISQAVIEEKYARDAVLFSKLHPLSLGFAELQLGDSLWIEQENTSNIDKRSQAIETFYLGIRDFIEGVKKDEGVKKETKLSQYQINRFFESLKTLELSYRKFPDLKQRYKLIQEKQENSNVWKEVDIDFFPDPTVEDNLAPSSDTTDSSSKNIENDLLQYQKELYHKIKNLKEEIRRQLDSAIKPQDDLLGNKKRPRSPDSHGHFFDSSERKKQRRQSPTSNQRWGR